MKNNGNKHAVQKMFLALYTRESQKRIRTNNCV